MLLQPGLAFFDFPCGSDWETYFDNAAVFWHPEWPGLVYQDWRKPLHAFLVGGLGELGGYTIAAQAISLASALAMVLGAGLAGRALGNRWTGAVAALAMACLAPLEQSSRWVNLYPLLAGMSALAFAAGAACLRWPRAGWAIAAGGLGGLALGVDSRGLTAALAAILMGLGGVVSLRGRTGRMLWVLLALALGLGGALAVDLGLQRSAGLEMRSFQQRIAVQSVVSFGPGSPPEVLAACVPNGEASSEAAISVDRDCARALLPHNQRTLRGQDVLPPLWLVGLSLLSLLPAGWGRRSSWGALVMLGGAAATLGLGMAMMEYPDRYALPLLLPLVVAVPLAFGRLAALVRPRLNAPRVVPLAAVLSSLAMVCLVWPGAPGVSRAPAESCSDAGITSPAYQQSVLAVEAWARRNLGPDDLLMDCTQAPLSQLLLPTRPPLMHTPQPEVDCVGWVNAPPSVSGALWLLTFSPGGAPGAGPLSPESMRAAGWKHKPVPGSRGDLLGRFLLWEQ